MHCWTSCRGPYNSIKLEAGALRQRQRQRGSRRSRHPGPGPTHPPQRRPRLRPHPLRSRSSGHLLPSVSLRLRPVPEHRPPHLLPFRGEEAGAGLPFGQVELEVELLLPPPSNNNSSNRPCPGARPLWKVASMRRSQAPAGGCKLCQHLG